VVSIQQPFAELRDRQLAAPEQMEAVDVGRTLGHG
jgi:hypothetical protein